MLRHDTTGYLPAALAHLRALKRPRPVRSHRFLSARHR